VAVVVVIIEARVQDERWGVAVVVVQRLPHLQKTELAEQPTPVEVAEHNKAQTQLIVEVMAEVELLS
jgi:hypothetical protein